jgi:C4-dicarboxylate transporter, DctM subunit
MTPNRTVAVFRKAEDYLAFASLALLALFPVVEIVARSVFRSGVHGSFRYIQHLVVWVTFLGGMITSREDRHLSLVVGYEALNARAKRIGGVLVRLVSVTVTTTLAWTSVSFLLLGFDPDSLIGIVPVRIAVIIVPVGYIVIA